MIGVLVGGNGFPERRPWYGWSSCGTPGSNPRGRSNRADRPTSPPSRGSEDMTMMHRMRGWPMSAIRRTMVSFALRASGRSCRRLVRYQAAATGGMIGATHPACRAGSDTGAIGRRSGALAHGFDDLERRPELPRSDLGDGRHVVDRRSGGSDEIGTCGPLQLSPRHARVAIGSASAPRARRYVRSRSTGGAPVPLPPRHAVPAP